MTEAAAMVEKLPARLKRAAAPEMVEAAPGVWRCAGREPPERSLAAWRANGDGTYRPIVDGARLVRVNDELVRALGFGGYNSGICALRRLARAGFIEMLPYAPGGTMLNLSSWLNHLRRVAEDPEFWQPGGRNLAHYLLANGLKKTTDHRQKTTDKRPDCAKATSGKPETTDRGGRRGRGEGR